VVVPGEEGHGHDPSLLDSHSLPHFVNSEPSVPPGFDSSTLNTTKLLEMHTACSFVVEEGPTDLSQDLQTSHSLQGGYERLYKRKISIKILSCNEEKLSRREELKKKTVGSLLHCAQSETNGYIDTDRTHAIESYVLRCTHTRCETVCHYCRDW